MEGPRGRDSAEPKNLLVYGWGFRVQSLRFQGFGDEVLEFEERVPSLCFIWRALHRIAPYTTRLERCAGQVATQIRRLVNADGSGTVIVSVSTLLAQEKVCQVAVRLRGSWRSALQYAPTPHTQSPYTMRLSGGLGCSGAREKCRRRKGQTLCLKRLRRRGSRAAGLAGCPGNPQPHTLNLVTASMSSPLRRQQGNAEF